jgi:peptidoglycan/LPS O-acetylase OafA/YrhL
MSDNLRVAGTGNLVFLDVLRATAVIGVVTFHTAGWALSNVDLSNGVLSAAATLFASGRLGVEVFFLFVRVSFVDALRRIFEVSI